MFRLSCLTVAVLTAVSLPALAQGPTLPQSTAACTTAPAVPAAVAKPVDTTAAGKHKIAPPATAQKTAAAQKTNATAPMKADPASPKTPVVAPAPAKTN